MIPRQEDSKQLLHRLILRAMNIRFVPGLFYGQMGLLLIVAQSCKQWKIPSIDLAADFLFEQIQKQLLNTSISSFAHGLPGICWGIEYLVYHGIMPGPANGVCMEMDKHIMDIDIRRAKDFSVENGVLGIWHYVQSRVQGNLMCSLPLPFDNMYLKDWRNLIEMHEDKFPLNSLEWITSAIDGSLRDSIPLSVRDYIINIDRVPESNNLSLHNGLAGYIATHYLDKV